MAAKDRGLFCKHHGLRTAYFNDMIKGGRGEHLGWQRLDTVEWLLHVSTSEYVVVVGGPKRFLDTVAKSRPHDMPFARRNFELFLAGEYMSGSGARLNVYHSWRLMPRHFQPPQVAALSDGAVCIISY